MTTLKVGIASYEDMKARTMAIARGERKPRRGEPKVWFTSLDSFARVLSDHNRALLELIAEEEPQSLAELAKLSGRAKSNLSRTPPDSGTVWPCRSSEGPERPGRTACALFRYRARSTDRDEREKKPEVRSARMISGWLSGYPHCISPLCYSLAPVSAAGAIS